MDTLRPAERHCCSLDSRLIYPHRHRTNTRHLVKIKIDFFFCEKNLHSVANSRQVEQVVIFQQKSKWCEYKTVSFQKSTVGNWTFFGFLFSKSFSFQQLVSRTSIVFSKQFCTTSMHCASFSP